MIIDAILFLNKDGAEGKKYGAKLLPHGNISGSPFAFHMSVRYNGITYVMMTANVRALDDKDPMRLTVRRSPEAYNWTQHGKFYLGELKDGRNRRA